MTFVYFGPKDLREVDPRPAPSLDAAEATVRRMLEARFSGDELTRALQALGLLPYERAFNPTGRDAWTRSKPLVSESAPLSEKCKNGHLRTRHTYITTAGDARCRACRQQSEKQRRMREREARAA